MPPKNSIVLGLNAYSHDAGVALLVDGRLVFAAEEERYDRIRHSAAFPRGAIAAALRHAGVQPEDVQAVAFCWRKDMARLNKALYVLWRLPRSLPFLLQKPDGMPRRVTYLRSVARLENDLRAAGLNAPVTYVDHHLAHAACAHRFGPRDEAALITADGMGEWTSTAAWTTDGDAPQQLDRQCYPHSLGKLYAAVTQHLGFCPDADEGKTMGLAPRGRPGLVEAFRTVLQPRAERLFRIDLKRFGYPWGQTRMGGERFERLFGPAREPESEILRRHEDLAFAAQACLEEVVLDIARRTRESSGQCHLGLAGGLFLNCVLNGRLARESGFDSVWVFPAAGDSGAAAGAAAVVAGCARSEVRHAYLGDGFLAEEIDRALAGRPYRVVDDPADHAAAALEQGRTVGWFSGRMEFGPRALGARSILADARDPRIQDRLNHTVKFRESFRPFAPAVLLEAAGDWFIDARPSPFMALTLMARTPAREQIPGVVHVDGSARVQTVGPNDGHPSFRRLIECFSRRTGVPVVLNTSLNVRGKPIVRTPTEAIGVFEKTALDVLILEDRILEKR
ncbi:MAG: hypothetical protein O7E54_07610 [Planctomycetota bacterium]|nr:hypothetical protein [Planctomycetota bacterium]